MSNSWSRKKTLDNSSFGRKNLSQRIQFSNKFVFKQEWGTWNLHYDAGRAHRSCRMWARVLHTSKRHIRNSFGRRLSLISAAAACRTRCQRECKKLMTFHPTPLVCRFARLNISLWQWLLNGLFLHASVPTTITHMCLSGYSRCELVLIFDEQVEPIFLRIRSGYRAESGTLG